jgi:hypothetical protein
MAVALSGMSYSLYQSYSHLSRFHSLKHIYHNGNPQARICYDEVFESKRQMEARNEFSSLYQHIKHTYYIWDHKIIPVLVKDILYFKHTHILKNTEIKALKEELLCFLNDLEQLAAQGEFKETGNKFELYISDIEIDTTYGYYWSEKVYMSFYNAFIFFAAVSTDITVYDSISDWIKSIKRCSVCISVINNKERTIFFDKQREIINTL